MAVMVMIVKGLRFGFFDLGGDRMVAPSGLLSSLLNSSPMELCVERAMC